MPFGVLLFVRAGTGGLEVFGAFDEPDGGLELALPPIEERIALRFDCVVSQWRCPFPLHRGSLLTAILGGCSRINGVWRLVARKTCFVADRCKQIELQVKQAEGGHFLYCGHARGRLCFAVEA